MTKSLYISNPISLQFKRWSVVDPGNTAFETKLVTFWHGAKPMEKESSKVASVDFFLWILSFEEPALTDNVKNGICQYCYVVRILGIYFLIVKLLDKIYLKLTIDLLNQLFHPKLSLLCFLAPLRGQKQKQQSELKFCCNWNFVWDNPMFSNSVIPAKWTVVTRT